MTHISEVADGIYQIETEEATIPGSMGFPRSTLVFLIADVPAVLVEIGPASAAQAVLNAIRRLGHDPSEVARAVVTHVHLDHAGGAGTLAGQLPGVQILVHQRGAPHLVDPTRLIEATKQAFGERFEDDYGPILPVPEQRVDAVIEGETIPLQGRELKAIYAPGHASHQMCIYDTKSRGIFSGEALGTPDTHAVSAVAGFDPDAALDTIDRLSKLDPLLVFCSHGGVVRDASAHIQLVRANMKAYGDIILKALKAGAPREKIAGMLEAYQLRHSPAEYRARIGQFDAIVTWHAAYFTKKGAV